ncbi:ATP-binding protein [Phytoactinopolyspora alkaliphila]|uniref:ATP-binding protein n=1 Tax=Phytoactinopolyspora alkaliphila TaxID=1783498 RepID=A0A6N9YQJ5_9ACTN|nr:ATP-binding protein [Phytoactinopolyspora alkaliphila]NED97215.1 ATP-binding protein [Phytoactinopolyspora alkaliphila]
MGATQSAGAPKLADKLRRRRQRRFVGRTGEIELFRSVLEAEDPAFAVLFVHGPGGVGKSALLEAFAEISTAAGATTIRIDARTVGPSPAAFNAALAASLGAPIGSSPVDALAVVDRPVLLLDTYELLAPLDGWLHDELLPDFPAAARVVVAGRNAPSAGWTSGAGWSDIVRSIALRNLPPDDARTFLTLNSVPARLHDRALGMTHAHPLALSLLVDVLKQHDALVPLTLKDMPDVVRVLLESFVDGVPGPQHRIALEVCAHARFTTEELLRAALGSDGAHDLFTWLRGLSFIDEAPEGLYPHDVARDALDADLRWRDPASYADLHRRIRRHVVDGTRSSVGDQRQRKVNDLVFLHRNNPSVSSFWEWSTLGHAYSDEYRAEDREPILAMTRRHQGAAQAELVARWMGRPAARFFPIRIGGGAPVGYGGILALHEATEADIAADPGARAVWSYVARHGPPRRGDEVYVARFFMDSVAYQRPSPSQNVISALHVTHLLAAQHLAWDFIAAYEDAEYWEPLFAYIDYHRAPAAEYEVGGHRYGVFAHDFRRLGVERWLEMMGEREIGAPVTEPTGTAELVLSHPEFADAVRAALRDLHRPDRLAENPLLRSRVVCDHSEGGGIAVLRELLHEAADTLRADARDDRAYRTVDRTFLRPAATQERAAEVLGLPFSTYRRHLARGVEGIAAWLWERELHGWK